jgi:hypothetical protein
MRTIATNTKSANIFKFNALNRKQFTNKRIASSHCGNLVRVALR